MKKILYVVMAALVLVACNPNEPKIVSKDKKMIDKGSKEILSLLGQKQKDVKKAFEAAGYEDVTDEVVHEGGLPQRLNLPAAKSATSIMAYAYNAPEDISVMSGEDEDELIDFFNEIVASKKVFIEAMLYFNENNRLAQIMLISAAGQEVKNVPFLYLTASTNIFASLEKPLEADEYNWSGALMEDPSEEGDEFTSNKKRAKFEEKFTAMAQEGETYASEEAQALVEDGFILYDLFWATDFTLLPLVGEGMPKDIDPLCGAILGASFTPKSEEP